MAMGIMSVTVPAVVAAAGIYFFDRTHPITQEIGNGRQASIGRMIAKVTEEGKNSSTKPKLAPQFDGLYCFETLVGH
ncbi:hypothetical protein JCGZ_25162 [Jatropha curcas]|uniref:Uncharacterized protein n=1 Tax=Jatropha curcas TaxID=180498 RepID=A0A067JLL3_JATCU|nr:hypothetical protein JCGZ_25162 [Jatropha curcas]